VPSRSLIWTFSSSMVRFVAAMEPVAFRQFTQWQRWPRRDWKRLSLIVTVMLPQRQLPVMESFNKAKSCCFGSPVRCDILLDDLGVVIVIDKDGELGVVLSLIQDYCCNCRDPA